VINETMARRYWPGRSAVGARIEWTTVGPQQWVRVVGVVSDVKAVSLERPDDPAAYIPIEQRRVPFMRWMTFVARVRGNPDAAAASVRAALVDMDRDQPVYGITTMNTAMAGAVAGRRFTMVLLTAFGAIAVTLAAVGVYATLSYTISRRTREIGIRMALGARRVDILRLVAGEGAAMVLVGFGAGLVTSIALTRPLQSLVFGVGRADPITLIATTGILLGVGMIAALVPARRAAAVDPSRTMRSS
jgi:putative ABC transport system permease protein